MANKKAVNDFAKSLYNELQKLSPNKPIQKEGVTVIENKNRVYVYVMKKKKRQFRTNQSQSESDNRPLAHFIKK